MRLTCGPIYFRTISEIRRELGLPTAEDLRRQFPRISAEEAAAFEAEKAAALAEREAAAAAAAALAEKEAAAAAAAAEAEAAAAEAEELKYKDLGKSIGTNVEVENLKSASDPIWGEASFLNKDLGESSGTTLAENPSPASGTEPKLKGKYIPKDLGESNKTEYLNPSANPAANLTGASGTKVEVKGSSVLKRPRKDLGEPIESIVEYLNVAATDTGSVTEAEVEGVSVCKCPRKDLDRPMSLIQRK